MTMTRAVLDAVYAERERQIERYGSNDDLLDGTGRNGSWLGPLSTLPNWQVEGVLRDEYEEYEYQTSKPTWMHLVREEVAEVFCETDPDRLEAELIQVAALCVSWVETLRGRNP